VNSSLSQLRQAAITSGLRQCDLFADCPPSVLDQIASLCTVRLLEAGEFLFHDYTPVSAFFIVQQGAIKLHRATPHTRDHVIHIFRPFEPLAEETLVSESGYCAAACATEPSQVFVLQKAGFLALMRSHLDLSLRLLRALSWQFNVLLGRLDELTFKDVPTRVADWLLDHCSDPESTAPQTIRVPETKRLLASELGTCGETLSRTLAKFRTKRLLSVNGRMVTVLCPLRLAQLFRHNKERTTTLPSRPRPGQAAPLPPRKRLPAQVYEQGETALQHNRLNIFDLS